MSISTMRDNPMPPGLSQAGMPLVGAWAPFGVAAARVAPGLAAGAPGAGVAGAGAVWVTCGGATEAGCAGVLGGVTAGVAGASAVCACAI